MQTEKKTTTVRKLGTARKSRVDADVEKQSMETTQVLDATKSADLVKPVVKKPRSPKTARQASSESVPLEEKKEKRSRPRKQSTESKSDSKTETSKQSNEHPTEKSAEPPAKKSPPVEKPKRVYSRKDTSLEKTGLCIGPARVKSVLLTASLNPREHMVRKLLLELNREQKGDNSVEELLSASSSVPESYKELSPSEWTLLCKTAVEVVKEAEYSYEESLRESYERKFVNDLTPERRDSYNQQRKESQQSSSFNQQLFNGSFDSKFYEGYTQFKTEKDTYLKHNKLTRSIALVNKLCVRLSSGTRNLIACFLDRVVEQFARNGIHSCMADNKHIVQLRHAMEQSAGYLDRVPLHSFLSTLPVYHTSMKWLRQCQRLKEEHDKQPNSTAESSRLVLPDYPISGYKHDFEGYVGEVCRSVRMCMEAECQDDQLKPEFLKTSVSKEFKQFCSAIVYETIMRIGSCLRLSVDRSGVKTISDSLVQHAIRQLHVVCGLSYEQTETLMSSRMEQFSNWRVSRKEERRKKNYERQAQQQ